MEAHDMDRITQALNVLHGINSAYTLSNEKVDALISETATAKVCIPVIGKFSSGKSALLNTSHAKRESYTLQARATRKSRPSNLCHAVLDL